MGLSHRHVAAALPYFVVMAEAAVGVVAGEIVLAVLLPQQLQSDVFVGAQFVVDDGEVRHRALGLRRSGGWDAVDGGGKQFRFQLFFGERDRPGQLGSFEAVQVIADRRLAEGNAFGDLALGEGQFEVKAQYVFDLAHGGSLSGHLLRMPVGLVSSAAVLDRIPTGIVIGFAQERRSLSVRNRDRIHAGMMIGIVRNTQAGKC